MTPMQDENAPGYDSQHDRVRWVACFDLLATRARIHEGGHLGVFDVYRDVLAYLAGRRESHVPVDLAWFSDTFVLTTADDSPQSFLDLDRLARQFLYAMLRAHRPLRGAIAHGPTYVDPRAHVLIGAALVEAHDYAKAQDWIGLLICPAAVTAMERIGLPIAERSEYAWWEPMWQKGRKPPRAHKRVPACRLDHLGDGRSDFDVLAALRAMAAVSPASPGTYDRAIDFVLANRGFRWRPHGGASRQATP